jgi:hypothetical protein
VRKISRAVNIPSPGLYLPGEHVTGRNLRVIGFIQLQNSRKLMAVMASIGAQASFHLLFQAISRREADGRPPRIPFIITNCSLRGRPL